MSSSTLKYLSIAIWAIYALNSPVLATTVTCANGWGSSINTGTTKCTDANNVAFTCITSSCNFGLAPDLGANPHELEFVHCHQTPANSFTVPGPGQPWNEQVHSVSYFDVTKTVIDAKGESFADNQVHEFVCTLADNPIRPTCGKCSL